MSQKEWSNSMKKVRWLLFCLWKFLFTVKVHHPTHESIELCWASFINNIKRLFFLHAFLLRGLVGLLLFWLCIDIRRTGSFFLWWNVKSSYDTKQHSFWWTLSGKSHRNIGISQHRPLCDIIFGCHHLWSLIKRENRFECCYMRTSKRKLTFMLPLDVLYNIR